MEDLLRNENGIAGEIITALGELTPGTIIDKEALSSIFGRCPTSIERAIERRELPPPVRIFGKARWTAGSILGHIESRLLEQADENRKEEERLSRYDA